MIIPELIIQQFLKDCITIISNDWLYHADKNKTILYDIFKRDDNLNLLKINKFDYFDQSAGILIKGGNEARKLEITLGYNTQRVALPTIHILLPNEVAGEQSLGNGENWDFEGEETFDFVNPDGTLSLRHRRTFNYSYDSTYQLMITSDNSSEVLLIYSFYKYMLHVLLPSLELFGLQNCKLGGQDLMYMNDYVPVDVFQRSLTISLNYFNSAKDIFSDSVKNAILVKGTAFDPHQLKT